MLEVKDLSVMIDKNEILKHISFSISDGEIVGLVGESGSGKTMTSLAIAGLLSKDAKMSGQIILDSECLNELSSKVRRKYNGSRISFIFQEPMTSLNPLMKIGKQIEEVLVLHTSLDKTQRYNRVMEIMKETELKEPEKLYHMYPNELSGGMRQRVVIAMASILKPSLIIADEPTTALDVETGKSILKLICKLNKECGSKVLLISHDLNIIRNTCTRVMVMQGGNIVETASADEIFNNPKNEYTKLLVRAVNGNIKENKFKGNKGILKLSDVSLYYREKGKKKYIAEGINFSINEGEILGLLGKSGCGKSTLSRAITGLFGNFDGRIEKLCDNEGIQMVFQDPYSSLNPSKTIGFLLSEPLRNKRRYSKKEIKDKVLEMLSQVELPLDFYNRYPDELSGGQRQRISIAIAIIGEPKLIIADEPVSALDVTVQSQVLELLLRVQKEQKISILLISHDVSVLERVCDRIITWDEITEKKKNI